MESPNLADKAYSKKKDRNKIIRTSFQVLLLVILLGSIAWYYLMQPVYQPYTEQAPRDNGFVALSYFGVQRTEGSQTLISEDNLRDHLEALKRQGYKTITTDDIYEYYTNNKELPEKSLYLMFEDGRRDTAIFANPILEDLNYHATTFNYPEKFDKGDTKFLLPDDLRKIGEDGYWDVGTNGYRLFFINVFDRYDNYLGEMDPLMFNMVAPYLGRRYNHYLMDYIRDKNGIPKESYDRMKSRISYDYQKLQMVYMDELGYVPKVSVLMHANTSEFGNNAQVSAVNAYWLQKLFEMNFNREGYCLNVPDSSIYDLTRMQPQAWWPVNHLLMRIKYDTNKDMIFNTGERERFERWELDKGAAEFKNEKIYLTTLPKENALLKLKNSYAYKNVAIDTDLVGNKAGTQVIFLRADENLNNYIAIKASGPYLSVVEKVNGKDTELFKRSFNELDGLEPISVDEDKHDAEVTALEAYSRYAPTEGLAKVYVNRLKEKTKETPQTIADGSPEYVPTLQMKEKGNCKLQIKLVNSTLSLTYNDKPLTSLSVSGGDRGEVMLGAWYTGAGWQQRNLDDDVYDAVFQNFELRDGITDTVLYSSNYSGWEKVKHTVYNWFENLIDWFVYHL